MITENTSTRHPDAARGNRAAQVAAWARGVVVEAGARARENFLAGRNEVQGTVLAPLYRTMVRAASGWLSAWPSGFSMAGCGAAEGTPPVTAQAWSIVRMPPSRVGVRRSLHLVDFSERAAGDAGAGASDYHQPVLADEVVEWLQPGPGKLVIDGTLGGGGHSELLLRAGAEVWGVDRDPEALAYAGARLARFGGMFRAIEGNHGELGAIPELSGGRKVDGILLDLGVSSRQLDEAGRGFSFQSDGPLDMRMGPSSPRDAAEVVNEWSEEELVRIFREYGEEKQARRIAAAMVARRRSRAFFSTLDLAGHIEKTIGRRGRIHPATKVFQAVRMAVNEELESLDAALRAAAGLLAPGGRLVVISFHSLEDRRVKHALRAASRPELDDPGWPEPRPNPGCIYDLPVRRAITAQAAELARNPRSRSAKLRVAERRGDGGFDPPGG